MKEFQAFYTIEDIKPYIKQYVQLSAKTDIQRNKLMHLEDTLVMYGVYSAETLEKCIKTIHTLPSRQSLYESLFAGKVTDAYEYYS